MDSAPHPIEKPTPPPPQFEPYGFSKFDGYAMMTGVALIFGGIIFSGTYKAYRDFHKTKPEIVNNVSVTIDVSNDPENAQAIRTIDSLAHLKNH